jgi:VCBS repeat-containing protein
MLNVGPVAVEDEYTIGQHATLVESAPALLANDSDADGDPIVVSAVDDSATVGLVAWDPNGSFAYDPLGEFDHLQVGETGTDTFSYTISDGQGGTDSAIVTITIVGSELPLASNDTYSTDEDTSLIVTPPGLLSNDTHPDTNQVLTVSEVNSSGTLGEITWNPDGSFTYDPNGQFDGLKEGNSAADLFSYTVRDALGGTDTATVIITIDGLNDAPVANEDSYQTDEKTRWSLTRILDCLANDTDADTNDTFRVTDVDTSGTLGSVLSWDADGSFEYRTLGWFSDLGEGQVGTDVFTYTITDENSASHEGTVTITVDGVNDPPRGDDDTYTTDEQQVLEISSPGLLSNDFDVDFGDSLSISAVDTSGTTGTVTWSANGGFIYDPNGQFDHLGDGEVVTDSFTYRVSDQHGGFDTPTVTITINGSGEIVNDDPVAADDDYSVAEDQTLSVPGPGLLANDTDPDGDQIRVLSLDTTSTVGIVTWGLDGSFNYDPVGRFDQLAQGDTGTDTFTYTVSDGRDGTDTASVTITINGVNEAPSADEDAYQTDEDTPLTVSTPGLLTNDSDTNSDGIEVTDVDTTGTLGEVTWSANGGFQYDPNGQFESLLDGEVATDTFTYTITDDHGATDTATVTMTITGVNEIGNEPPVAVDDAYNAENDELLLITAPGLLGNDTDPNGDQLRIVSTNTSGTLGLVAFQPDGSFGYDAFGKFDDLGPGETATDSFSYTISDQQGGSDTATVTITVSGGPGDNQPPVAEDDTYSTNEDAPLSIDAPGLLANDTDADVDDVLQVTAVDTSQTVGQVVFSADGSFEYDPDGQFNQLGIGETATDSFQYTVSDQQGGTDTASVTITLVGADNQSPIAADDGYTTNENAPLSIDAPGLLTNDTDADVDDLLRVTAVDLTGTVGNVVWAPDGSFEYDPDGQFDHLAAGDTATDSFGYTLSDGQGGNDTATVTITITGINNAPIAVDDAHSTDKGLILTIPTPGFLINDSDVDDGDELTILEVDDSATLGLVAYFSTGSFGYDPFGQFDDLQEGETATDSFTYTISDRDGLTDTATVTITITNTPEGPASVSISDASQVEGDGDPASMVFTVSLSHVPVEVVKVDYATNGGSAEQGVDFQETSGTLVFNPGVSTQTVSVPLIGDLLDEIDETFQVELTRPVNVLIEDALADATILDDDDPPSISIGDATLVEGDQGSSDAVFVVSLSAISSKTITLNFTTADESATSVDDYVAASGTLTFAPGETEKQILVSVNGDSAYEPNETFAVVLSSATNGTLVGPPAKGTIGNDDDQPTISIDDAEISEGDEGTSELVFSVSLSHASFESIPFDFATADGTATDVDGDYEPTSGSLVFEPGESLTLEVKVTVYGDTVEETTESFSVNLSNVLNALLGDTQATGTILDDDGANASLSGMVFIDVNNSGIRDEMESGIPDVTIHLNGTDDLGNSVALTTVTAVDGSYMFPELRAGTYEIIESQHSAFLDGIDSSGTLGGNVDNDRIWGIEVGNDAVGSENNFGEFGLRPENISLWMFFASSQSSLQTIPAFSADEDLHGSPDGEGEPTQSAVENSASVADSRLGNALAPSSSDNAEGESSAGFVEIAEFSSGSEYTVTSESDTNAAPNDRAEGDAAKQVTASASFEPSPAEKNREAWNFSALPAIADSQYDAFSDDDDSVDQPMATSHLDELKNNVGGLTDWKAYLLEELLNDDWVREISNRNDKEATGIENLIDLLLEQHDFGLTS